MEEWKEIPGFNGKYLVSNIGRVKSLPNHLHQKEIILKQGQGNSGYNIVNLSLPNHKQKVFNVHRLVAQAFIPNPNHFEQVNHINGDKTYNHIDNLEWVTRRYNAIHSREILKNNKGCCKEIPVRCIETGVIYNSAKEAGKAMNRRGSSISSAVNGSRHTCAGYHWEHAL